VVAGANYCRFAVGPLQETVRSSLGLSDTQIALLQGPALAFPVVLTAIPFGMLIDRLSRVRLLAVFAIAELIGTAATAQAPSFAIFFAARCLTGVAAAATMTAAFSLVADLCPADLRGRGTMIVGIGQIVGASAAYGAGGVLLSWLGSSAQDWRPAMLLGLVLAAPAVASALALREPPRQDMGKKNMSPAAAARILWRARQSVIPLLACVIMVSVAECAALIWAAPMFARSFHYSPLEVGGVMAAALFISGGVGAIAGGLLSDIGQQEGGPARTMTLLSRLLLLSIGTAAFGLVGNALLASALLILFMTAGGVISIVTTTLATLMIPTEVRGFFLALLFAAGTICGIGLAPIAVTAVSLLIGGPATIGVALSIICLSTCLVGAAVVRLGARDVPEAALA
jgi:MFS family permease